MTDKVFDFITSTIRNEPHYKYELEQQACRPLDFVMVCLALELVQPSRNRAKHHRERERFYTLKLEQAEKEFREKGVTIEVFDPKTNTYTSMSSGAISDRGVSLSTPLSQIPIHQPRVDQRLADAVTNAKNKMLEHRQKAVSFEKLVRAYGLAPNREIKLTIDDVDFFQLGEAPTPLEPLPEPPAEQPHPELVV